ncbi:MAG TPA: HIRAN domain-containing protein [Syntrophorhabdaceae bacterium]|nr:HIRAN domain-containing protein [Syntrophorhabdaceae bacterium]
MDRRSFIKSIFSLPFFTFFLPLKKGTEKSKNILLIETVVAGIRYYDAERIWNSLHVGESLLLKREPHNPYDERAIEVYRGNDKLGYIPRKDNGVISQVLDRNEKLVTHIFWLKKDTDPWNRIGIRVYMEVNV